MRSVLPPPQANAKPDSVFPLKLIQPILAKSVFAELLNIILPKSFPVEALSALEKLL